MYSDQAFFVFSLFDILSNELFREKLFIVFYVFYIFCLPLQKTILKNTNQIGPCFLVSFIFSLSLEKSHHGHGLFKLKALVIKRFAKGIRFVVMPLLCITTILRKQLNRFCSV